MLMQSYVCALHLHVVHRVINHRSILLLCARLCVLSIDFSERYLTVHALVHGFLCFGTFIRSYNSEAGAHKVKTEFQQLARGNHSQAQVRGCQTRAAMYVHYNMDGYCYQPLLFSDLARYSYTAAIVLRLSTHNVCVACPRVTLALTDCLNDAVVTPNTCAD